MGLVKFLLQGVRTGCVNEGALVTLVQVDADEKSALLTRQAVSDDVAAGTKFQPCGASANAVPVPERCQRRTLNGRGGLVTSESGPWQSRVYQARR